MTRRRLAAAAVALALITIARIALVQHLPDHGYFAKYLVFADEILRGAIPRTRLLDVSPGYFWTMVALRAGGLGVTAIRAVQIALVSVAAFLAALAARRFGGVAMIAAALFVLASRGALLCATELEPETLILLLDAAALAAWMHERRTLSGALLGLSAICRPSALLVVIALVVVARRNVVRFAVAAAVPLVIMLTVNAALTGEVALMDPGTVFYEGMNPNATGLAGVQPRIVNDLERLSREPDTLHEAYRFVASRAAGRPLSRTEANRWWSGKALAFGRAYPWAALRLVGRKILFALHAYEPQDLVTMARKDAELPHWLFLPFSVLAALALIALLRRPPGIAPVVAFAIATGVVLVAFYVTTRQRNALIAPMAVLAAAGISVILSEAKDPLGNCDGGPSPSARLRMTAAVILSEAKDPLGNCDGGPSPSARLRMTAGALLVAVLLSIPTNAQREDLAAWRGETNAFDQAMALEDAGRWSEADAILSTLTDYHPARENRAVSSVAYYRARAALHLGRDPRALLDQAERDAPGDAHVLALRARFGDARAGARLGALHDPFTVARARRDAARD